MSQVEQQTVFGFIAGWGEFPKVVARGLLQQQRRVIGIGVRDHTDPQVAEYCDDYIEVGLGQLGRALRFMKSHDVRYATMAGKIHKTTLFQPLFWLRHFPDLTCIRTFAPHFIINSRDRKDDTLLGTIVEAFAARGIEFQPATNYLPELLVKTGFLTQRRPTRTELKDIEYGWRIAKEMGRMDIGQAVAVKGRTVLAVEAIEGTDLCIERAGRLCRAGGFTVVKVAKPQQDMRFDVPTIGRGTLESLVAAGSRVLAVESDKTILVDEDDTIRFADAHGISIVAVQDGKCVHWAEEAA